MLSKNDSWCLVKKEFLEWYINKLESILGVDDPGSAPAIGSHSIYYGYAGIAPSLRRLVVDVEGECGVRVLQFVGKVELRLKSYIEMFGRHQPASLLGGAPGIILGYIDSLLLGGGRAGGGRCFDWVQPILKGLKGRDTLINGDLGTGLGGYILSLIWLGRELGWDNKELLVKLARSLLMWVTETPFGLAQKYRSGHSFAPISGLAHGSAGLAVVFLELGIECGSAHLISVAESLIEHELRMMCSRQLWSDTRRRASGAAAESGATAERFRSTGYSWCYGSSGIIMCLEYFEDRIGGACYRRYSRQIRTLTFDYINRTGLLDKQDEFCICHGLGSLIPLFELYDGSRAPDVRKKVIERSISFIIGAVNDGGNQFLGKGFRTGDKLGLSPVLRDLSRLGYFTGILGLFTAVDSIVEGRRNPLLLLPFQELSRSR